MSDTYLIGDNQKLEDEKRIANFAPSGKVENSSNLSFTSTDAQSESVQLEKVVNTKENEQFRNMLAMSSILSSLYLTLKKEVTRRKITLQEAVIQQIIQGARVDQVNP